MPYSVQIESPFRARQGLPSPVRSGMGKPSLDADEGRPFVLRVGLIFADAAIDNSAGRAVDSDAVLLVLEEATRSLSAERWTALFDFRPTLERVTRHLYDALIDSLNAVSYLEIEDSTAGLTVRYQP